MAPVPLPGNPPPLPINPESLIALQQAIAVGARVVRFQDRTIEYQSTDDMIKAANYINGLINSGGVTSAGSQYRQIRFYTNKGL